MKQYRWDLFFQPLPLAFFMGTFIVAFLIWLFWRYRGEKDFILGPEQLGASSYNLKIFFGWVPFILGIHLAFPLLYNGIQGNLFFSYNPLSGTLAFWLGVLQILMALAFLYGGLTRPAAIILGALWILGIDLVGLDSTLASIQILGFALFFYLAGRGPYAIDRLLFPLLEPNIAYVNYALLFLRITVGLNIIIFGLLDKFANIPHAIAFFDANPFLNFTPFSNYVYVLLTAGLQILAGLLLTAGVFPRIVSIAALICINGSLTLYAWGELIDYLPLFASLAIFYVWEPNNPHQKLLWVEAIRNKMPHEI